MKDRIELAKYFRELGFRVGAEIGVFEGSYSRALCRYNPELTLYSIDAWGLLGPKSKDGRNAWLYERAKKKLAGYNAIIMRAASVDAARQFPYESLDFVYIDANHTYPCVMDDLISWAPKVRVGGIVAGHDYQAPSVRQAVDEYADKHGITILTTEQDSFNKRSQLVERSWYFIK